MLAQQREAQLRQANRMAQYRYQQQYAQRLRQQQAMFASQQYNYGNDPYYYTPDSYQYTYGGNAYQTNQYGADVLRQAVNDGYHPRRHGRPPGRLA